MENLKTPQELADAFRVCKRTILNAIKVGELTAYINPKDRRVYLIKWDEAVGWNIDRKAKTNHIYGKEMPAQ